MTYDMSENLEKTLEIIAKNVVRVRKAKGITQEELAFKADVDRTYIGYIENSKHNISLGTLIKIAAALDVELNELYQTRFEKYSQQTG